MVRNNDEYPPTLLRGIPNKSPQFFDTLGSVTGYIFKPHSDQQPVNGFYKESINWEDDDTVEVFTLSQRKPDNTLKFKGGVARVLREEINRMMEEVPYANTVAYNRERIVANPDEGIEGNPYHGNLLLDETRVDSSVMKKAFFSRLKRTIDDVIPPIEEVNNGQ